MPDGIKKVFVTPLADSGSTSDKEGVGCLRFEGNKVYKWVKFTGTNAVAAGDAVCYVLTDLALTTVDKANTAVGAGVALAAHAAGTVEYGWIQIKGVYAGVTSVGAAATGNTITTTGSTAGNFKVAAAVTDCPMGVVADSGTKVVDLDCPM